MMRRKKSLIVNINKNEIIIYKQTKNNRSKNEKYLIIMILHRIFLRNKEKINLEKI